MPQKRRQNPNGVGPRLVSNVVPWIEQYWHSHKVFPNDSVLMAQFGWDREFLDKVYRSKLFKSALEQRGIERRSNLHPIQVATISVVTNFADTRSQDQKLASIGVTPEMFQGWLSQPTFKRELTARSEEILDNSIPDVLAELAKKARSGNLSAVKMLLEMTGRAQSQELINSRRLIQVVLEAVQENVKDTDALFAIQKAIMGESPALGNTPVAPPVALEAVPESEEEAS